jgi:Asp-tRNA(Asn)/Glu-tRNA(Gln) amidotransferase A subunit family amidase
MPSPRRSSKPKPEFDSGWASAGEIAAAVAKGRVSAVSIVEDTLARITARDPVLNSFTDVLAERARARAKSIDAARAKRKNLGPLAGVPFAVKNLFDVKGLPTRAGSKINRELPPATHGSKQRAPC